MWFNMSSSFHCRQSQHGSSKCLWIVCEWIASFSCISASITPYAMLQHRWLVGRKTFQFQSWSSNYFHDPWRPGFYELPMPQNSISNNIWLRMISYHIISANTAYHWIILISKNIISDIAKTTPVAANCPKSTRPSTKTWAKGTSNAKHVPSHPRQESQHEQVGSNDALETLESRLDMFGPGIDDSGKNVLASCGFWIL